MEFGELRLAVMDEHHVDFVVLSLAGPGVQAEKDGAVAERKARAVNDFLAGEIQKRPARFGGFAHLAMHSPSQAASELERCGASIVSPNTSQGPARSIRAVWSETMNATL
jgi:2,3-dihydroxybenzoate decarboxylase